jgi:hypothetical protein
VSSWQGRALSSVHTYRGTPSDARASAPIRSISGAHHASGWRRASHGTGTTVRDEVNGDGQAGKQQTQVYRRARLRSLVNLASNPLVEVDCDVA